MPASSPSAPMTAQCGASSVKPVRANYLLCANSKINNSEVFVMAQGTYVALP